MKYSVELRAPHESQFENFQNEKFGGDRCRVTLTREDGHLVFHIEADDSVALRATLNAITKLCTVCEKADNI